MLFSTVHPLNVFLVVCFELLALQLERVGDQASLWCPGLGTQTDLLGDLESLQFRWLGKSRIASQIDRYSVIRLQVRHRHTKSELIS